MDFAEAIAVEPEHGDYKAFFMHTLINHPYPRYNAQIKTAISICLNDDDIGHLPLFPSWHVNVLDNPDMAFLPQLQACHRYEYFLQALSFDNIWALLNDDFFCLGLKKLLMKNYDLERILTYLRRYLLCQASPEELKNAAPFLIALATQCFFNEYLFYMSEEECEKLTALKADSDPFNILLSACYCPLYQMQDTKQREAGLHNSELPGIEALVQVQITEPLEEQRLQADIKNFGRISNAVSKAVQEQYEEHPFPRWLAIGSPREENQKKLSAERNILVAGCGTGQQAVAVAGNFSYADITAIDLSRASLAYAQRKAQQYTLDNLTFMHGDILEVSALGKPFDYIACGGVLHHMDSPKDGLAALKNVLKPGGIMRIALYSDIARRNIVRVQNWIEERGIPSTPEGIRDFRKTFIDGGSQELFGETLPYFDCFSISEMRDLFFHVQEHRFTCLSLKDLLEELDLDLLVFAPEAHAAHQRFKELFPEDPTATDLENWHKIEQNNPDLFLGMYKLYICHKGAHAPGSIPEWLQV